MKITNEVMKSVNETEKVFCNKCGKELSKHPGLDHIQIKGQFGYESNRDLDEYDMDICYDCLEELCNSCKINPITECDW